MGLDMYLKYRRNVSGYEFTGDTAAYQSLVAAAGLDEIASKTSPYATVEVTAIYWRKANAIHGWFVRELADGVDECQPIRVPLAKLRELRELCFEAISVPAGMSMADHAARVLPPADGFFFGSTAIDDWYVKDLEHTMEEIDRLLRFIPNEHGEGWDWDLCYQASW